MNAPETFDRSKPLYRLFEMEDGSRAWYTVELDNTPGRAVSGVEAEVIQAHVDGSDWKDAFYAAFERHKKATVYAKLVEPYEVPEGVDAILRGARIVDWGGKVALGAIYGDRKGRWQDGHSIHTSYIVNGPDENGVIRTRSGSTYKLEMAADGHA